MTILIVCALAVVTLAACVVAGFAVQQRRTAEHERDEAIAKYDAAYLIGYSAGQDDAKREYKNSVPYQDGFHAGWGARDEQVLELSS